MIVTEWRDAKAYDPPNGERLLFQRSDGFVAYGIRRGDYVYLLRYKSTKWPVGDLLRWAREKHRDE